MKRGWLIYDEEGAARNAWFIEECLRYAQEYGLDLRLKIAVNGRVDESDLPDFALVRTIAPTMSAWLETQDIRVINSAEVSAVANDKWLTHQRALSLDVPVMATNVSSACETGSPFGYPVVVKLRDGHGGKDVYKLDGEREYRAFWTAHRSENFITQAMCSDVGKDMRVYVLGGEVLGAVLRTSATDFRSNFSLGGEVQSVPVPVQIAKMVKKLQETMRLDFVGIDFISHRGEWVLNEMEDVVGSRMLYKTTGLDVAKAYIEYVKNTIEKTACKGA